MFAVIYSGKVKPNREEEYKNLWHEIAEFFICECGAIGSCLHQTIDGTWLAYSRWPNKETRSAVWPDGTGRMLPPEIQKRIHQLQDCIAETFPEIHLEVIDDLFEKKVIV